MSNSYFDFKKFRVRHDRCAQKVGTDGALLGAWAALPGGQQPNILDVGTGSGLIALMMAQRCPNASVTALDIEEASVSQARENALASPFGSRIKVVQEDIRLFASHHRFDAIVCNPPFFTADTLPPNSQRALARNASLLPFAELAACAAQLLAEDGTFSVIVPADARPSFVAACLACGLRLIRLCWVKTVERKPAKRCLMTFTKEHAAVDAPQDEQTLVLQTYNKRSEAYEQLMSDFYL